MSETLSIKAEADIKSLELGEQSELADNNQAELADNDHEIPAYVLPLFGLVNSSDTKVRLWPWGARGSLSESIWSHPLAQTPLTIEEVPIVMADIFAGLAQAPIEETEEIEVENEVAETEEPQKALNDGAKKEEKQEKVETVQKSSAKPDAKPAAETKATTVGRPQQPARAAEATLSKTASTQKTATPHTGSIPAVDNLQPERLAPTNETTSNSTQDTALGSVDAAPVFIENLVIIPEPEPKSADVGQFTVLEQLLPIDEVIAPQKFAEIPEQIFQETLESEQVVVLGTIEDHQVLEPNQELQISHVSATEIKPNTEVGDAVSAEVAPADFQLETIGNVTSDSVYLEGQPDLYVEEIDEPILSQQPESSVEAKQFISREIVEEIPSLRPVVLPEQTVTTDLEKLKRSNVILEKITQISQKLDTADESQPEADPKEQLEKLFVELLENLKINYTPELIESLVLCAANNGNWQEETMKLIDKKQSNDQPQGYGTNEAISQMLTSGGMDNKAAELGSMLGAMACALAI